MDTFTQSIYEELSADILHAAKKRRASSAEVTINIEAGFLASSRLGAVEKVEHHQDKGMSITVYMGNQTGCASSSDLSKQAIDSAVQKACDIANYTNSDPYAGLADPALMAFDYPNLDLDHPWGITPRTALDMAMECEDLAMSDARISNSEGVSVSSHRTLHVYANSHGFLGSYLATEHTMNCVLIAQELDQMHRDYDYTTARDAQELSPITALAQHAQEKTVRRLGARRLKTRSAPVIFSAEVARSLMGNFVSAISGSNLYRKSSFLLDQLGAQVFPQHISVLQDPHIKRGIGSVAFDSEGVKTVKQYFLEHGILQNYILNSYSARKLGRVSTGNAGGVYNLLVINSDITLPALLTKMDTGLLITELIGQGVNIVTGDYSRGAFGYWVEGGKIQYPVEEITVAGNLKDMFLHLVDVAADVDKRGRIQTGSILIEEMMIAGE